MPSGFLFSVFPSILFLAPFSAFFIRIALALVLLYALKKHWSVTDIKFRLLAAAELAVAVSVALGAWTQTGALVGGALAIFWLARPAMRPVSFIATLLTIVLCISLILTGAGPFAFDLPL